MMNRNNKYMKKKLLLIICMECLAFGLAGCGSESTAESGLKLEPLPAVGTEQAKDEAVIGPEKDKTEESAVNTVKPETQNESKTVTDADIITGNPEVGMVTAYDGNGSEVIMTENTDGTYLTGDGTTYYLGEDGVYRSNGKADMYVNKPQTSDNGTSGAISQEQALAAIKNYCFANNPELEKMINSGDYGAYFDVSDSENGEIVVLYRSYTAAQIRYYIDPTTGGVYVTELVPGIMDEEQRTDESFNIKDYK